MVPAYAASLCQERGHQVFWDDAIAQELGYAAWLDRLRAQKPELVAIESKTPVITRHWKIIKDIKECLPGAMVVLMGDHVTALPKESLENCPVDYVITGGDYDFSLADLADYLSGKTQALPGGIWHWQDGQIATGN